MHITRRQIAALQVCKTKEELEDTFMLFHVTNMKQKQRYLLMAMGNPQVFFTPEIPTLKHSYFLLSSSLYRVTGGMLPNSKKLWEYSGNRKNRLQMQIYGC